MHQRKLVYPDGRVRYQQVIDDRWRDIPQPSDEVETFMVLDEQFVILLSSPNDDGTECVVAVPIDQLPAPLGVASIL